ncbi:uncharacterized protein PAC_11167 [Phialocephala subalpina]|uniref:Homeobox domain-containing protein n=1 Tax=Phialocephala subalpina TaxID=576137 RepID=A0A1L7X8C9_9HELO|nr:uncharacterized protein PAC_11167 [Phialocephala subalpina]
MSANNDNADSGYPTGTQSSFGSRLEPVSLRGMELPRSSYSRSPSVNQPRQEPAAMSTLTMRAPTMLPSPSDIGRNMPWDRRPLELPSRPRSAEREELPSLRQIIGPDYYHETRPPGRQEVEYSTDSYSPSSAPSARRTPSEYLQSPSMHKRRRLSTDDDYEDSRDRSVPRLYRSPPRAAARSLNTALSPTSAARRAPGNPHDSRTDSNRSSPYSGPGTSIQSLDPPSSTRTNWRTLPRIPALALDPSSPRSRTNFNEYALDSSRSGAQTYPQLSISAFNPPTTVSVHPHPTFSYGYQPPRNQSYSGPSSYSMTHERSPFSVGHHPYSGNTYSYSGMDNEGLNDAKQRKRRGNLPKETTDKLRAWFIQHLQHPYPTEDEKQDLMRQTNLQMNQISNWFINARRRQLPAMINSARAETDARSARGAEGTVPGESTSDFGDDREKNSDGEGSGYEDDFLARRKLDSRKRDSI